jgi:hypothetical protein
LRKIRLHSARKPEKLRQITLFLSKLGDFVFLLKHFRHLAGNEPRTMNTISSQTEMPVGLSTSRALAAFVSNGFGPTRTWGPAASRAWLPTPAPILPARKASLAKASRLSNLWVSSADDGFAEKLMMLLLVVAAIVGIGYGFSALVDLVSNWAGFNAGVAHLLG